MSDFTEIVQVAACAVAWAAVLSAQEEGDSND